MARKPKTPFNPADAAGINPSDLPYYKNHPNATAPGFVDPNNPDPHLLQFYNNHPVAASILTNLAALPFYRNHPRQKAPALDPNHPDPHLLNWYRNHPYAPRPAWINQALIGNGPGNLPAPDNPADSTSNGQQQQIGDQLGGPDFWQQLAPMLGQNASNSYQFADAWTGQKFIGPAKPGTGWQDIGFAQLRHDLTLPVPVPNVNMGV